MIQSRQKLEEQWKKRHNEIQKHKRQKENTNEHKTLELKQQERPEFTKQSEKTYIMQLVGGKPRDAGRDRAQQRKAQATSGTHVRISDEDRRRGKPNTKT